MTINPRFTLGTLDLTDAPYAVEFGGDLGNAQNIVQIIDSLLGDGQIERVTGAENRTLSMPVLLEASDMAALADAEAAVALECARDLNEFTVDPGDGFGAATVYQVFRGQLSFNRDDVEEQNGFRRYTLTMRALPFGYSVDEVIDVATDFVATPNTVVMADGLSATGWTSPAGTVTSSGGVLQVPSSLISGPTTSSGADYREHVADATYTFAAVDLTSTRFVSADFEMAGCFNAYPYAYVDGVLARMVSRAAQPSGLTRITWVVLADSSVTSLRFEIRGTSATTIGGAAPTVTGRVDNVTRSNVGPGTSTTGRESLRVVEVTGSARTAGAVSIGHATSGLGDVLLYTSPNLGENYSPALRQWMTTAGAAVDASSVSGFTNTGSVTYDIDARALPSGPYLLMMRARAITTDAPVTPAVSSRVGGGGTILSTTTLPALTVPVSVGAMAVYTLGVVTLPDTKVPEQSTSTVRIVLTSVGSFVIDELWAFCLEDDADLTQVACGAGTPALGTVHNRLFLDSPTVANGGAPALYVGTAADRSDAFTPGAAIASWGRHQFPAGEVRVFVVTTGAAYPTTSVRHRPAWLHHAGK